MRPIPLKLRAEMADDPFYKQCCLAYLENCSGKIEWHHVIIHAGKQLNEKWAIVPACQYHHKRAENRAIKEQFLIIALNRTTDEHLETLSRAINYKHLKNRLNAIYS